MAAFSTAAFFTDSFSVDAFSFGDPVADTTDTHDGFIDHESIDRALRRRDEEIREQRDRLRRDLLGAVERVTDKPPPLDQSLKQLAAIARRAEDFDYEAMLREIAAIDERAIANAAAAQEAIRARAEREARARVERARRESEALLLTLIIADL